MRNSEEFLLPVIPAPEYSDGNLWPESPPIERGKDSRVKSEEFLLPVIPTTAMTKAKTVEESVCSVL